MELPTHTPAKGIVNHLVLLNAAEWDPIIDSSETTEDEIIESQAAEDEVLPSSKQQRKGAFVFFKRKTRGKKKAVSPKSVMAEF